MSKKQPDTTKDWRGAPITVGALCIYGAPVGRSIAMVEAEVVGWTKSGRVNVRPIRRAYGSYGDMKEVVHVGHDRLTIVTELPPSDLPNEQQKAAARNRKMLDHYRQLVIDFESGKPLPHQMELQWYIDRRNELQEKVWEDEAKGLG